MRLAGICFAVLNAAVSLAQPRFDAASVKVNRSFAPGRSMRVSGGPGTDDSGRFVYPRGRLKFLLMKAWNIQVDQLAGTPWVIDPDGDDSYAVEATMPTKTTNADFQAMLQRLLTERFQLRFHHEIRSFPGYELTVANGGAAIRETAQNLSRPTEQSDDRPGPLGSDGFPVLPAGPAASGRIGPRPGTSEVSGSIAHRSGGVARSFAE